MDQAAYAAAPKAPELIGKPEDWLNTGNTALHMYGHNGLLQNSAPMAVHPVILVDFWEYTCVNCLRTLPYVKDWAARYKSSGLIVIGIHTPEFNFAHEKSNVASAVKRLGIAYPVLVDSSYANWSAYNNQFWPMKYVIDQHGKIVYTHPGEGGYAETEQRLRDLLLAANPGETLPPAYGDHESAIKSDRPVYDMTGELYAGADKGRLQNPGGFNTGHATQFPAISVGRWTDGELVVAGDWKFADEYVQHVGDNVLDSVGVRYHARDAVAVIKPESAQPFKVYVTQDGKPVPRADAGSDLAYESDGRSYLLIDSPREYQIVHNQEFSAHTLALSPASDQFRLYSFDFAPT